MSAFIAEEPSSSCQGSAPGGRERAQTGWWMAQGKVESTKKIVPGLPSRLHTWEETDAVQQMRDKQAQVDVVIRKLWDWLGLALLDSD